ncbi:MAG: hypothetical protein GEU83_21220 [Pseudonocardiaceae bacterium]|nr:hypothetical protein [Pseudonocardiaceae bacterium]
MTTGAFEEDPRDRLDALRERIRSGDLSSAERDELDQLVFVVAVADRRADTATREFPGEVAAQRAVSARAWSRVAAQLQVMLSHAGARLDGEVPSHAPSRPWS